MPTNNAPSQEELRAAWLAESPRHRLRKAFPRYANLNVLAGDRWKPLVWRLARTLSETANYAAQPHIYDYVSRGQLDQLMQVGAMARGIRSMAAAYADKPARWLQLQPFVVDKLQIALGFLQETARRGHAGINELRAASDFYAETSRGVYEDMCGLAERGAIIDFAGLTITYRTAPVVLKGFAFGQFDIVLRIEPPLTRDSFRVFALSPVYPTTTVNPDLRLTHPHIRNEQPCLGSLNHQIMSALYGNSLSWFFQMIETLLNTYTAAGAYTTLEHWVNTANRSKKQHAADVMQRASFLLGCVRPGGHCHISGEVFTILYACSACGAHVSEQHINHCRECDESYCTTCGEAGYAFSEELRCPCQVFACECGNTVLYDDSLYCERCDTRHCGADECGCACYDDDDGDEDRDESESDTPFFENVPAPVQWHRPEPVRYVVTTPTEQPVEHVAQPPAQPVIPIMFWST